jgi:hypothetical protein
LTILYRSNSLATFTARNPVRYIGCSARQKWLAASARNLTRGPRPRLPRPLSFLFRLVAYTTFLPVRGRAPRGGGVREGRLSVADLLGLGECRCFNLANLPRVPEVVDCAVGIMIGRPRTRRYAQGHGTQDLYRFELSRWRTLRPVWGSSMAPCAWCWFG